MTARRHALHEMRRKLLVTSGDEDMAADISWKRRDSVTAVVSPLVEGGVFTVRGAKTLMLLDGREAILAKPQKIPGHHRACGEKWKEIVDWFLGDPSAKACMRK